MKKILIFDIDGTLLLSGGAGIKAFEQAFEETFGVKNAWGNTIPDGKTDPHIFEEIAHRVLKRKMESKECGDLGKRYITYFKAMIDDSPRFRLMPGVNQILPQLAKREDLVLGIATGNVKETALAKLKKGGLHHYFKFGAYACDSEDRAQIFHLAIQRGLAQPGFEKVPLNQIYIIGDAPQDILCGKKNGIRTVAVTAHRDNPQELANLNPDLLIPDLLSLRGAL
jgi:phosphoglycolate phosphatase